MPPVSFMLARDSFPLKIIGPNIWRFEKKHYLCHRKKIKTMEERKFRNRTEQIEWYDQQMGWGPLTAEDRQAIDEAVRLVTNL